MTRAKSRNRMLAAVAAILGLGASSQLDGSLGNGRSVHAAGQFTGGAFGGRKGGKRKSQGRRRGRGRR